MFLLKMVRKNKNIIKKYKKSIQKNICKIVNFGSTKLTKPKKNFLETHIMVQHFRNTFIILLYFILTHKELTL